MRPWWIARGCMAVAWEDSLPSLLGEELGRHSFSIARILAPGTSSVSSKYVSGGARPCARPTLGAAPQGPLRMGQEVGPSPLHPPWESPLRASSRELMLLSPPARASVFMLKCDRGMKRKDKCTWLSAASLETVIEGALIIFSFIMK